MKWFKWKIAFVRCEVIYFLGGIPRSHTNALNYKNINSAVEDLKTKEVSNSLV